MRIADGFRAFREGFDRRLLYQYWLAVKQHAWEVAWGATVVGIPFTLYTLYVSPSLRLLGWAVAVWILIGGYYVWRSEYLKHLPKLKIEDKIYLQETPVKTSMGYEVGDRIYVQIIPKCITDSPVTGCQGHLLRILKHSDTGWVETAMNEPSELEWSLHEYRPLTIHPGIDQRLNICYWDKDQRIITPALAHLPLRWTSVFASPGLAFGHVNGREVPLDEAAIKQLREAGDPVAETMGSYGVFRFDIRFTAAECSSLDISVSVSLDGSEWNEPFTQIYKAQT
jgi:hypothetical protein